jgi:hypothetical protein
VVGESQAQHSARSARHVSGRKLLFPDAEPVATSVHLKTFYQRQLTEKEAKLRLEYDIVIQVREKKKNVFVFCFLFAFRTSIARMCMCVCVSDVNMMYPTVMIACLHRHFDRKSGIFTRFQRRTERDWCFICLVESTRQQ